MIVMVKLSFIAYLQFTYITSLSPYKNIPRSFPPCRWGNWTSERSCYFSVHIWQELEPQLEPRSMPKPILSHWPYIPDLSEPICATRTIYIYILCFSWPFLFSWRKKKKFPWKKHVHYVRITVPWHLLSLYLNSTRDVPTCLLCPLLLPSTSPPAHFPCCHGGEHY